MRQSYNRMDKRAQRTGAVISQVDQGLRAYLQKVYAYMGLGLLVTGLVSYFVATTPSIGMPILTSPLRWVFLIATLAIPFALGMGLQRLSFRAAQGLFWLYATLMGLSLFPIFLIYQEISILRIAMISAAMFGSMSIYGYTTKKDLSAWGSFLFMGLIGVILASVVNLFMKSSALEFALSIITVIVFTGLTAYDTQRIKQMYSSALSKDHQGKIAVWGALMLYLDFINMFLAMLRLFGDRR